MEIDFELRRARRLRDSMDVLSGNDSTGELNFIVRKSVCAAGALKVYYKVVNVLRDEAV